ncbi:methyl-accepting chemotaxis protein [Spirochaeta dissipatitropha]
MKLLNSLSIGKKLTGWIVLLMLLLAAGIGIASYVQAYQAVQNQIRMNAPQMAAYGADVIRGVLDRYLAVAGEMSMHPEIRSMEWERQRLELERQTNRGGFLGMGIIFSDGIARYPDGTTADLGDREYFQWAMRGEANFSNVIISRVTNSAVMMIAAPIRNNNGDISAVLIARQDAGWLIDTTSRIGYGERGYSYAIDGSGTLIAHDNRDLVMEQVNFIEESRRNQEYAGLAEMLRDMVQGRSGYHEYFFEGQTRVFGYAPIPGSSWSIAVGADQSDVFSEIYAMRLGIILMTLLFLAISVILAVLLARSISRPILSATAFMDVLSGGELAHSVSADLLERGDEIGTLARGMQTMRTRLYDTVQRINDSSRQVAENSNELSEIGQQVAYGASQMSNVAQEMSQGASEQAASVEQVSASMEEIAASIQQNADNAEATEQIARQSAENASRSGDAVAETVVAMKQIAEKISIIEDIARETNMLSLNAAIEAARAGEHGKGFAVVAAQVRKLAENSAAAAKEISQLSTSSVMVAEQAGGMLSEMVPHIQRTAELVQEISATSREMNSGASQVNTAVSQLDQVVQQSAASAEEVASTSEEQSSQTDTLASTAEQLSSQAQDLRDIIAFFRLGQQEALEQSPAARAARPAVTSRAHSTRSPGAVKPANRTEPKSTGITLRDKRFQIEDDSDFEEM